MRRPLVSVLAVGAAAAAVIGFSAIPASADSSITATYPVTGSTYIKALNATVRLGPGTLVSTLDLSTSALSSSLTLPAATASFKELGIIPVTATTELIQDGAATGTADISTNTVTTTAQVTLKITSLSVAGLSVPVGSRCETRTPASITLASEAGFKLLSGGTLAGTYTIPRFSHCGLATLLINLTIPGKGNTITLTLGAAKLS